MAKVGIEVSVAIGEAAKLANVDVVAAYPITPQTHIVEHLAQLVADGELDAAYIPVESEHSAMSACLGASAVGARTFTATAGPGLEYMHNVLYVASSMRLPVVMAVTNRALSAPISIWGDHSDAMAVRDTGWIGFHLSHMIEPLLLPEQSQVDQFIPPYQYPLPLNPDKPVTMGGFGPPDIYSEAKKAQEVNLTAAKEVILECWNEFGNIFQRYYCPVECYHSQDARVLLLTMGSFSETAMTAIDTMRREGKNVGLIKLRLWRPFPFAEIRQAVKDAEVLIVLDRALSFGGPGGPVCSEIRSALYNEDKKPKVISFVGGLGGRDITSVGFEEIINRGIEISQTGSEQEFEMFGVRE